VPFALGFPVFSPPFFHQVVLYVPNLENPLFFKVWLSDQRRHEVVDFPPAGFFVFLVGFSYVPPLPSIPPFSFVPKDFIFSFVCCIRKSLTRFRPKSCGLLLVLTTPFSIVYRYACPASSGRPSVPSLVAWGRPVFSWVTFLLVSCPHSCMLGMGDSLFPVHCFLLAGFFSVLFFSPSDSIQDSYSVFSATGA